MYAHFDRDETGNEPIENLDREELIRTVIALRNDVYSIASDIHEVIKKNDRLEKEVQRLRSHRTEEPQRNKAQQVKQEIDNLVSLFDAASTRRARATRAAENRILEDRADQAQSPWMKKMMMMMMIADML